LYEEFNDPVSGTPMVRIYQARVSEPVEGSVGEFATVTVEDRTFHGVIKQIDQVEVVLVVG